MLSETRRASPALVDVDAVYFISADGDLGQGLDHVVALQNNISLGEKNPAEKQELIFIYAALKLHEILAY